MSRARRIELTAAFLAVLAAGAIALLVAPLPPLERATAPSEGWARGIEFGVLVFVFWMAFSAVGLMRAKVSVGLDGVSAERSELETLASTASDELRETTTNLAAHVQRLHGNVEVLLELQRRTGERVDGLLASHTALLLSPPTVQVELRDDGDGEPAATPGGAG